MASDNSQSDQNGDFYLSSSEKWFFGTPVFFGLCCLLPLAATAYVSMWQPALKAFAVLFLAAGTAFAGGAGLGFLFGVPRVAPPAVVDAANAANRANSGRVMPASSFMNSTANLVEIADWLLKLLLGAGLTQFRTILHTIYHISSVLGTGLSIPGQLGSGEPGVIISFCLGYFFVWGCLMSYIMTQKWMPDILERQADKAAARAAARNAKWAAANAALPS